MESPHIAQHHQVWGVRPDALPEIRSFARGEITGEQMASRIDAPDPEAAAPRVRSTGGVAVISLAGVITPKGSFSFFGPSSSGLVAFRAALREAVASEDIGTIVLNVDSPGGRVDLVPETAADVRAAKEVKPVIAVANTMAASAAYWIASQATELVVSPSGEVGSVGVFLVHEEFSAMDERIGIKSTVIKAGRFKAEGNPYEPLTEEAKENFQAEVDEVYDVFVDDVAMGRGVSTSKVRSGFGEGRMASAQRALAMGMADRVETIESVVTGLVRGSSGNRRAEEETAGLQAAKELETQQIADGESRRLAQIAQSLNETSESLKEDRNE